MYNSVMEDVNIREDPSVFEGPNRFGTDTRTMKRSKMRLWMLKFTHGVEIGAYLAYLGHYSRTKDPEVLKIAYEEDLHKKQLKIILRTYKSSTNPIIDFIFYAIGNMVRYLCYISPVFLLNKVATVLEVFAIYSYRELAKEFQDSKEILLEMGKTEERHKEYFRSLN